MISILPIDFSFVEMTKESQSNKQPWTMAKAFRYPAFPNAGAWLNQWSVMTQTIGGNYGLAKTRFLDP
jgi:hypothetical protein